MGQVPEKPKTVYGIIGDGRLAKHFCHYLNLLEIPFKQWSRKKHPETDPATALDGCEPILIIISDDQIESFLVRHPLLQEKKVYHCSGSLVVKGVPSVHPLMTFSRTLYDLDLYKTIPFVMEETEGVEDLPGLPNPVFRIPCEKKALYHALCVFSGNLTTILWQQAFEGFRGLEIPAKVLQPYLRRVTENIADDPENCLTGPIARGDIKTIRRNLDSLGPRERSVYQAFLGLKEIDV